MTAPAHAWLRRLSDYHSGGASDAERIAIEEHLAACAECREALAMYRRFYTLLRSPLRLDAMSARFDDPTVPMTTMRRAAPPAREPRTPPGRNRRALAGLAAGLAAALIIGGFAALVAPRLRTPVASGTPTPLASVTAQSTATAQAPAPKGFVCANPLGSRMTYVYMRGDQYLYAVTGCSAPRQLAHTHVFPLAWSPSNRYLAVWTSDYPAPDKIEIVNTQTSAVIPTNVAMDFGREPRVGGKYPIFFGWLDDNTFLSGVTTVTSNAQGYEQPGPTTLERVDVSTGATRSIGAIAGWANIGFGVGPNLHIVAGGRYLFYASYDKAGTTAYLHRFDLTTGTDTLLVSLGMYASGGCQGSTMCGWTAPWAVAPDGFHILYHRPGAASSPTDTSLPKDTPLLYANPDGSGASEPFGSQLAASLVSPAFSPSGGMAVITGVFSGSDPFSGAPQMKLVTFGSPATVVTGSFASWRADSGALVFFGANSGPSLYDIASGKATALEANSNYYLWGNAGSPA
ncbi:MAG TPA: zf-HC2 domain-containing protein [Ktedonobacterales bacterium]|nr:zf-HC2 domain-containing protein [Ktedonobacterales bacterium]